MSCGYASTKPPPGECKSCAAVAGEPKDLQQAAPGAIGLLRLLLQPHPDLAGRLGEQVAPVLVPLLEDRLAAGDAIGGLRCRARLPGQTGGPAPAAPAPSRTARHHPDAGQEHDMARFMDLHEDLKPPAEALPQIAEDTRHARADQFGVRQVELYHNPDGTVDCLLEGPDEDAIRQHHAALGVPCSDVYQVSSLT